MRRSREGKQQEEARAFNDALGHASTALGRASRCVTGGLGGRDILRRLARLRADVDGLRSTQTKLFEDNDLLPEETQAERSRARRQKRAEERKQRKVEAHGQTH